jgi:hypothetical protein
LTLKEGTHTIEFEITIEFEKKRLSLIQDDIKYVKGASDDID